MARLEKVKRNHDCHNCKKRLHSEGSMRVNFHGYNYCIPCGYQEIKEEYDELYSFMSMLKDKFGKELVVARLER